MPKPDLDVGDIDVGRYDIDAYETVPVTFSPEERFPLEVDPRNRGDGPADRSKAAVTMFIDGEFVLMDTNSTDALDPMEKDSNQNLSFDIPDNLEDGRYLVSVWVDYYHVISESNEKNNFKNFWVIIESEGQPDLDIGDVDVGIHDIDAGETVPGTFSPGERFPLEVDPRNRGDGAADKSKAAVTIFIDGEFVVMDTNSTDALESMEKDSNQNLSFDIPDNLEEGAYLLTVWADYYNDISESNEKNNFQNFWVVVEEEPNQTPTISGADLHKLEPGAIINGVDLVSVNDPDGLTDIREVRFWDSTPGTDGGRLYFDDNPVSSSSITVGWGGISRVEYHAGPDSGENEIIVEVTDSAGNMASHLVKFNIVSEERVEDSQADDQQLTPQTIAEKTFSEVLEDIAIFVESSAHLSEMQKRAQLEILQRLDDAGFEDHVRVNFWSDFEHKDFFANTQPEFAISEYLQSKGVTGADYRVAAGSLAILEEMGFVLDRVGGIVGLAATAFELGGEAGDGQAQTATIIKAAIEIGAAVVSWPLTAFMVGTNFIPWPDPYGDDPDYKFSDLIDDFLDHNLSVYADWGNAALETFAEGVNWIAEGLADFQPSDWDDATHQTSSPPVGEGIYYTPWQTAVDEWQASQFGTGGTFGYGEFGYEGEGVSDGVGQPNTDGGNGSSDGDDDQGPTEGDDQPSQDGGVGPSSGGGATETSSDVHNTQDEQEEGPSAPIAPETTTREKILGDGRLKVTEYIDDVKSKVTITDESDAHAFTSIEKLFGADGQLQSSLRVNDDGTTVQNSFENDVLSHQLRTDAEDAHNWVTIEKFFDVDGLIESSLRVNNNGTTLQNSFENGVLSHQLRTDAGDVKKWLTIEKVFDQNGDALGQLKIMDDGTEKITYLQDGIDIWG